MTDTRLNGVIRAFEAGKPAFTCFSKVDKLTAQASSTSAASATRFNTCSTARRSPKAAPSRLR